MAVVLANPILVVAKAKQSLVVVSRDRVYIPSLWVEEALKRSFRRRRRGIRR
jgi:hypothetical protein